MYWDCKIAPQIEQRTSYLIIKIKSRKTCSWFGSSGMLKEIKAIEKSQLIDFHTRIR